MNAIRTRSPTKKEVFSYKFEKNLIGETLRGHIFDLALVSHSDFSIAVDTWLDLHGATTKSSRKTYSVKHAEIWLLWLLLDSFFLWVACASLSRRDRYWRSALDPDSRHLRHFSGRDAIFVQQAIHDAFACPTSACVRQIGVLD